MLGGAGSPCGGVGEDLLTVTVVRDEYGYGMKVSGDNPVYVQSVKEHGAAWRAGLRAGDRILRVDSVPVQHHTHQQVVHMIRANPTTVLTVQQNTSRHKTPITAPVPVNLEKQRQLEVSKVHTMRLMLEKEQKFIRDLRNEISKVPDVRKQAELQSAELRCSKLQHEIDTIMAGQPMEGAPSTPRLVGRKPPDKSSSQLSNSGFLSGLPRSLSNLTGQSLRNLRQARNKTSQGSPPPLVRQNSDESNNKRRHVHNNTVPMVPTTCLDNVTPPPLPPRSIERPKRNPLSPPPMNPLALPNKPCNSTSPVHKQYYKGRYHSDKFPMHQSMPGSGEDPRQFRRSSHSLDGEVEGPQPNSIAMQMSYPLVNAPPPSLQTDNRTGVAILHMRSRSSPEQLDHEQTRSACGAPPARAPSPASPAPPPAPPPAAPWGERDTPPPGTPPPPYHTNTQPCSDPQRAIISMEEEDDAPASDNSTYSGLFSNLRSVRESKARTAVLLNWLLGERRCACACLLLVLTDAYRAASGVPAHTLRRWAYEIHSTFLVPSAVLQLNGVDENMANEIEHVLVNDFEKEELLLNVFRKARQKAKDELSQQLTEFQVKRQVGLGTLYGPEDAVIDKCDVDKQQEQVVVEQLLCAQLRAVSQHAHAHAHAHTHAHAAPHAHAHATGDAQHVLLAALIAAALALHCRAAAVAGAVGGARASFLQRDKLYKQRVKQLAKQHPQPFVVRGHHLQLEALTSVAHCHHCDLVVSGLAPQAYLCTDCKLRVHRACARSVEEGCCLDGEHHNNRISRFMERIHHNNQPNNLDVNEKKSRKASGPGHFLNMERSFRKVEDEPPWEQTLTPPLTDRRDESDESLYESADGHSDVISASDDTLPRLGKTPTISKESLKLAVTDEEVDFVKVKKTHRKTMSLSNPLDIVRHDWFDSGKKDIEKNSHQKKSRESLWSEEDRESINGSSMKLDQIRRNSKKEDKNQGNSRKSSTNEAPKVRKISKGSSVGGLGFFRRKKTPTSVKPVESVAEDDKMLSFGEILDFTKLFLEGEKRFAVLCEARLQRPVETDSEDEPRTPKQLPEHRRRLSRQTSRGKSRVRGKSQSLKINTLRKSHSGTLKKGKKKSVKAPSVGRSRQASIVEQTPIAQKKISDSTKHNSWLFSGSRGESRREGSTDEPTAPDADVDTSDPNTKEPDKDNNWRSPAGRGVNRAESCRERDAPRRGKHRNASDPNRLTAHNHHDLEPGAATAPSGSSSSSSLSSRSNESNTVAAEHQASQSDWSEEDEPLAAQWSDSLPSHVLESLVLCAKVRKRQEVIHELIVSERSHVRWLRVLGTVFLRPLEANGLLAADELRALFPNLGAVRDHHARLYAELRAARNDAAATDHVVRLRPVADALLNTLGEAGYAASVSKFCRQQRMALEALRERRRKSKELQQFLTSREQLPVCGRLQLKDMLVCVWQRLTKYQLLLESILKTADSEDESAEDVERLRRAHIVAKDVLQTVDTAIRTAENQHRLKSIQSKLEVRAGGAGGAGGEWDELRRLELAAHALRYEGELSIRSEAGKRVSLLALLLDDCLVLLQREGDRFLLKPIPHPAHHLSPLIKWDKVLFRPNAAKRNTFFLMNINSVQMHELSANSAPEYAAWVKHIQEAPLAKLSDVKSTITPSHQPSHSNDDSGVNVSRNPSDASEKSSSTVPLDEPIEPEKHVVMCSTDIEEKDRDNNSIERDDRSSVDKDDDKEEKNSSAPRRPTVGRISTHGAGAAPLEPPAAVTVTPPAAALAHTATVALTDREHLRRLDAVVERALRAKSALVGAALGVPPHCYRHLADFAVADALGELADLETSVEASAGGAGGAAQEPDMYQLLLAAHAQASQLTRYVQRAVTLRESDAVSARAGRCDACGARPPRHAHVHAHAHAHAHARAQESFEVLPHPDEIKSESAERQALTEALEKDVNEVVAQLDLQEDSAGEDGLDDSLECAGDAALLATRVWHVAAGLRGTLARLLRAAPPATHEHAARRTLAALAEQNDALRAAARHDHQYSNEEHPYTKTGLDPSPQEQPSNGG